MWLLRNSLKLQHSDVDGIGGTLLIALYERRRNEVGVLWPNAGPVPSKAHAADTCTMKVMHIRMTWGDARGSKDSQHYDQLFHAHADIFT